MVSPEHVADGIVVVVVAAKSLLDVRFGRRRDSTSSHRFDKIDKNIEKLFAFIVGPDGENGIRGDLRKLESRVDQVEEREITRLERNQLLPHEIGSLRPPRT